MIILEPCRSIVYTEELHLTWHNCFTILLTCFHSKDSYITLMVNYTAGVSKLGFCMARGICVTATSELKVHRTSSELLLAMQ